MRPSRTVHLLLPFLLCTLQVQAQGSAENEDAAVEAAEAWMSEIDAGAYADSWTNASPMVQEAVTQDEWAAAIQQVRDQIGALQERELADSQYRTSLPEAPEGEYMVLRYASSFERAPEVFEVVVMAGSDGGPWQAAGYQIVPAQQQQQPQQQPPQQQPQQQPDSQP